MFLLMDLLLCVFDSVCELFGETIFVNCLVKQFEICLGVFAILLLNVMDLLNVGGALMDRPLWSSKECVCCACDPSEHQD